MPRGAFPEFALQRTLLAATTGSESEVAGYALFASALGRIRLIHLCVREESRRQGIAKLLVDEVSRHYSHLPGIRVRCRSDYAAKDAWPALGFTAMNEVAGRGKDGSTLVVWWKSHGLPDLFNVDDEATTALTVAIDHNIFLDLAVHRNRPGASESQYLEADWLASQLQLSLTPETFNEIHRLGDASERRRQRSAATKFPLLNPSTDSFERHLADLQANIPELRPQHDSDVKHIAYAAASGATIFVTRDTELIEIAGDAASSSGVRVLRPSDVVPHLEELRDAFRYRPAALRGTEYTVEDLPAGSENELRSLIDMAGGERRAAFAALLRSLASSPSIRHKAARAPSGDIVATWAHEATRDAIVVPLLRHTRHSLASTIIRLILAEMRRTAVSLGAPRIVITDSHVSAACREALSDDGYILSGGTYVASVLDIRDADDALRALDLRHPLHNEVALARRTDSPAVTAALEHFLWPAKILDASLPSYIVPIQPRFALELFAMQDTLWARDPLLGISPEHVYYRSARMNPSAPARILWYASGTGRDRIGGVVACSQLVQVVVDEPRVLHRRYKHLGVYRLVDIQNSGKGSHATALRFRDTERFDRPVTFERLRELAGNRRMGTLQSPTMISAEHFGAIYNEGTRRGAR